MNSMKTVSEQLREAIEKSGHSRYAITKETGVAASVLSRFVASGRGLRSHNIDAICAYLGLELRQVRKPPNPPADLRIAGAGGRGMKGTSPSAKARKRVEKSKTDADTSKRSKSQEGN